MISDKEYAPYYAQYINPLQNNGKSIIENLVESQQSFEGVLEGLPEEKHNYAYAQGKWTIKELIQHIIDTERVFCYRALCFARNDKTPLPGFNQDVFVNNDNANDRNLEELLDEMKTLRKSTIQLYKSFSDEALLRIGIASGNNMSVRALGLLFSGYQNHHVNVLKERYF